MIQRTNGELGSSLPEISRLWGSNYMLNHPASLYPYFGKSRIFETLGEVLHQKLYLTQASKSPIFPVLLKSNMDCSQFLANSGFWLQEKLAMMHSQFFASNDYKLLHFLERVTNHRTSTVCFISKLPALVVTSLSNAQKHLDGTKCSLLFCKQLLDVRQQMNFLF